ncbi:hypothetical protein KUCAC02_002011, partial [Chaenocephalus aceratus]
TSSSRRSHFSSLHTAAAATETFGTVNIFMLDTDLNPVCGKLKPRALVEKTSGQQLSDGYSEIAEFQIIHHLAAWRVAQVCQALRLKRVS